MLRIERASSSDSGQVFALSGRIAAGHLPELADIVRGAAGCGPIVFDLAGVRLVDRAAVHFFVSGDGRGVALRNCPGYLETWLHLEGRPA